MASVESALRKAVADLNAVRARWALVGGLAVSARTIPRFTKDLDFAVAVADDGEAEETVLGHKSMALTCGYSFTDLNGRATPQVIEMGVQLPVGQRPFAHATVPPVPQPTL